MIVNDVFESLILWGFWASCGYGGLPGIKMFLKIKLSGVKQFEKLLKDIVLLTNPILWSRKTILDPLPTLF